MLAMLYGSEAWCLKESNVGILQWIECSVVRAICGSQLRQKNIYGLDVDVGFELTMEQMAMASSICLYGHVLRR